MVRKHAVTPLKKALPHDPYVMRISRLTVDKLGVKLYDKASAVVAELVANAYDADAERVQVRIPLATALATKEKGKVKDSGYVIEVEDDGHGMTPEEAIHHFLVVGNDRRKRGAALSRRKRRPVMGRKGIGKLAPFGICQRIEVLSSGGEKTPNGFLTTHFFMDFEKILQDDDSPVELEPGTEDSTFRPRSGTLIRLSKFLPKRVPDRETFFRQLAVRFVFAKPDFDVYVEDTKTGAPSEKVDTLLIPLIDSTQVDLSGRPVITNSGERLPVRGWLALAKDAYKNEEMAGVRIYARGKIVGVTRDFNQPAGFTGEFTMRSYLVGEVHAEWLDLDDGDDLVRTDRQDILWDSEYGQALRTWGAEIIKEIGAASRAPRRKRTSDIFLNKSDIANRARARFADEAVVNVAIDLAKQIGGFAAEDELTDSTYVKDLTEVILSVAPHKALMEAFREFGQEVSGGPVTLEDLQDLFSKSRVAEIASYGQIAAERVRVIRALEELVDGDVNEDEFQNLLAEAPWLIEPTWTVITINQGLKTFKSAFEKFWHKKTGKSVDLAIGMTTKRPDFTLIAVGGRLHIVEIKKSNHLLSDTDCERLSNYVEVFDEFFDKHRSFAVEFPAGWQIDLVCEGEALKKPPNKHAYAGYISRGIVKRLSWTDFLMRAKKAHESFLDINDKAADRATGKTAKRTTNRTSSKARRTKKRKKSSK